MFWLFFCRFAAGEGWSNSLARTLKVPICPSGPHVHRVPPGSRYSCKLPLQVLAQGSARLLTLSHFLTISCLIEPIFFFLTSTTPDKQNTQRTRVPLAQKKKRGKKQQQQKTETCSHSSVLLSRLAFISSFALRTRRRRHRCLLLNSWAAPVLLVGHGGGCGGEVGGLREPTLTMMDLTRGKC